MRQVCPHCGAPMYHKVCEYCGMPAKQPTASAGTKSRKFVWLAIALAAAVLLGVVGVTSVAVKRIHSGVSTVLAGKSENSTNDAAALKKMQESGVFPSGTYLVGEEIPAGEYILVSEYSETDHLFYAGIYADREKEQEISGGWNEFSVIMQLEEGTYFSFSWANCYDVTKKNVPNDPTKHPGMFCVGRDIDPGTYTIVPYPDEPHELHPTYAVYTELGSVAPMIAESGSLYNPANSKVLDSAEVTLEGGQADFAKVPGRHTAPGTHCGDRGVPWAGRPGVPCLQGQNAPDGTALPGKQRDLRLSLLWDALAHERHHRRAGTAPGRADPCRRSPQRSGKADQVFAGGQAL